MNFYRPPALYETLEAIGSVYRALRAWQFYPPGHPTRKTSIIKAHASILNVLDGHDLTLTCGSAGFSFPDGESIRDISRLCDSLSFELFVRRAKSITFLHDLRQEDLLDLVRVLVLPQETVSTSGGLDKIFSDHGVSTVWVNEFDLSIIRSIRKDRELSGVTPPSLDSIEAYGEFAFNTFETSDKLASFDPQKELQLHLSQLVSTLDPTLYQIYLNQALSCADQIVATGLPQYVIPLIELLSEQTEDTNYPSNIRESAHFGLEQIAMDERVVKHTLKIIGDNNAISTFAAVSLLAVAQTHIAPLIVEAVGTVESLSLRKTLNRVLSDWGDRAIPKLLPFLEDPRWFIVRNVCGVLGTIGNRDTTAAIIPLLNNDDIRVRKEAVRTLAKIGGTESEAALIGAMHQGDSTLLSQIIASLGGMKSKKALIELLTIIFTSDIFLKELNLKIDALTAISVIGESAVAPKIADILDTRFIFAPKRAIKLKIAAAECLGHIGNSEVLENLRRHKNDFGPLGKACAAAIVAIEARKK